MFPQEGTICRWLCAAIVALLCCTGARCETLFKLSDLSDDERNDLFTQVDAYGAVTAFLDYCRRPPNLVAQLTAIAPGCVDPTSFTAVLDRYTAAVVRNSGPYRCAGPGAATMIPEYEAKIASVVSKMKTACRLRSFYKISFPKIHFP
jgi:hypothetical protein